MKKKTKCDKGHDLIQDFDFHYKNYYACNVCGNSFHQQFDEDIGIDRCPQCQYDVCRNCNPYEKKVEPLNPTVKEELIEKAKKASE